MQGGPCLPVSEMRAQKHGQQAVDTHYFIFKNRIKVILSEWNGFQLLFQEPKVGCESEIV